ncbi:MAG TPA: hypothetical protein VHL58_09315 [Thermoanaerobaculia bacterium]|nr:hypothetical protein [Thermoanaerobaculia bacterium]
MSELAQPAPIPTIRQSHLPARVTGRVTRVARKHRLILLSSAILLGVLFFPSLFMGRVLSPNDAYCNYYPWAAQKTVDVQNPLIQDPPFSYLTLMSMLKSDWSSFHWNRYIGSGLPGFGSVAAAVLSPFILIPTLLLPLGWIYSGIVLLKILIPLFFGYRWLREERLGKTGATLGALVIAAAGPCAVWWLWQGSNATALYPVGMYFIARAFHGKRNALIAYGLLAICFALSGFPAAVAYGGYLFLCYAIFLTIRRWRFPEGDAIRASFASILALMISAPFLAPFISFLQRTGYLETRQLAGARYFFPWHHLLALVAPYRLGDPAGHQWIGEPALGAMNNFVELTIYLGLLTLPLALVGLFRRRSGARFFFLALFLLLLVALCGGAGATQLIGSLPGIRFSPLPRLRVLLPIPAAYLAASGCALLRRINPLRGGFFAHGGRWITEILIVIIAACDLGFFAARFYPYVRFQDSLPAPSETLQFLQREQGPFRIAPFFPYLFPNAAELFRLEDIRSHWGAEKQYRELMHRIDPTSLDQPTVVLFNSLKFNFSDPLLAMLNVRYYVEQPDIDIIRWTIESGTQPIYAADTMMSFRSGEVLRRSVRIEAGPFYAVAIPFQFQTALGKDSFIGMQMLTPSGQVVASARFGAEELRKRQRLFLAVPRACPKSVPVTVALTSRGVWGMVGASKESAPGETPLAVGRVKVPLILEHEFSDGRLFRNLAELPRYYPVWLLKTMSDEVFMKRNDLDFFTTAYSATPSAGLASWLAEVPAGLRDAQVSILPFRGGRQGMNVQSSSAFFLASSEKLTPELRVYVDGKPVEALPINRMFAGVPVPAGRHRVDFVRRIGRGWWTVSLAGLLLLIGTGAVEMRSRGGRG